MVSLNLKMFKFLNIKNSKQGLTLVEVLAAMAIFSVLSVSIVTLFTTSINSQSSILQNQQLLNETGYVIEYMHKAIRMAYRDDGTLPSSSVGMCTDDSPATTYNVVGSSIYFIGFDNTAGTSGEYRCMKFYLDGTSNKIKFQESSDLTWENADAATPMELTSSQIKVDALNFNVTDQTIGSNQPRVTIMLTMESNTKRVSPIPTITVQTTASQRNLNVP
jgi:prepilin-type N-terminal cleavage/methylation domain-containing protein